MLGLISVKNLSYDYLNKKVLNDISFQVEKPCIVGILGVNGAGKTTLINCMQGIRCEYVGSINILGYEAKDRNKNMLMSIGVLLQNNAYINQIKVYEFFKFISALYNKSISEQKIEFF